MLGPCWALDLTPSGLYSSVTCPIQTAGMSAPFNPIAALMQGPAVPSFHPMASFYEQDLIRSLQQELELYKMERAEWKRVLTSWQTEGTRLRCQNMAYQDQIQALQERCAFLQHELDAFQVFHKSNEQPASSASARSPQPAASGPVPFSRPFR